MGRRLFIDILLAMGASALFLGIAPRTGVFGTSSIPLPAIQLSNHDGHAAVGCAGACLTIGGRRLTILTPGQSYAASVLVSYSGPTPRHLGVELPVFSTGGSSCSQLNPARLLSLTIARGTNRLYSGTLADFATRFGGARRLTLSGARWHPGEAQKLTFTYHLDADVSPSYSGCHTQAVFMVVTAP